MLTLTLYESSLRHSYHYLRIQRPKPRTSKLLFPSYKGFCSFVNRPVQCQESDWFKDEQKLEISAFGLAILWWCDGKKADVIGFRTNVLNVESRSHFRQFLATKKSTFDANKVLQGLHAYYTPMRYKRYNLWVWPF